MESMYLLIPLSALLVLAILGIFGWALFGGQFEELDGEDERILVERDPAQTMAASDVQGREKTEQV